MIADKATAEGSTSTDVLVTAQKMNIKILPAKKMVDFVEKRLDERLHEMDMKSRSSASALTTIGHQSLHGDGTSPSLKMKSVLATPLVAPFIKIEAIDSNSRPMYKKLSKWPDFSYDYKSTGCPFRITNNTTSSKPMHHPVPDKAVAVKSGFRKVQLDQKCVKITGTYARDRKRHCEVCQVDFDKLPEVSNVLIVLS